MSFSTETIDRIVANVLGSLGTSALRERTVVQSEAESADLTGEPNLQSAGSGYGAVELSERVVTAELLEQLPVGGAVIVSAKSIVTPAAWDVVRAHQLQISRSGIATQHSQAGTNGRVREQKQTQQSTGFRLVIVQHSSAIQQLLDEWTGPPRELFGCPDDAAKFAISEISRGGAEGILIFAEQVHRAVCLANRHARVKAVAVVDRGDVQIVRKQLRANVWCVNPVGRSYFELRNLLRAIQEG